MELSYCATLLICIMYQFEYMTLTSDLAENDTQYTTNHFYLYDSYDSEITWEYIEDRINANDTLTFLSLFKSGFQRNLVHRQLRSCPVSRLCLFELVTDRWPTFSPCCQECSCGFPGCLEVGTCCVDILMLNLGSEADTGTFTPDVRTTLLEKSCVPLYLAENEAVNHTDTDGAFMHATCPSGSDQQLVHNCTREYTSKILYYQDIVPVMNILNAESFRNKYCAYCNLIPDEMLEKADVYLRCIEELSIISEHEVIKIALEGNVCDLAFRPSLHMQFQYCNSLTISECNITGEWLKFDPDIEKACATYSAPIEIMKVFYKNVFCAMCNGVHVDEMACERKIDVTNPFAFSGLLKLETDDIFAAENVYGDSNCSENQIHDYVFDTCRNIVCPPFTSLIQGQCLDAFTEVETAKYTLYLKITPLEVTKLMNAHALADILLNYIRTLPLFGYYICGTELVYHIHSDAERNSTNKLDKVILEYFKARINVYLSYFHIPSEVYEKYILLDKSIHKMTTFDYKTMKLHVFEVSFDIVDLDPMPFDIIANLPREIRFGYENELPLLLQNLLENFTISSPNKTGQDVFHLKRKDDIRDCEELGIIQVNLLYLNKCPKILIVQEQIAWKRTGDDILFTEGNFIVNHSDYYFNANGNIMVCVDIYVEYMSQFKRSLTDRVSPMIVVSIISSSLSIVSLLFTLIVFLILPRLRKSLPGKTNLSLVFVLLCAQCLYLVSSVGGLDIGTKECGAVGILLHFVWLLSIMWMNVCTYHMFHVLTRTKIVSSASGVSRFLMYHLYAVTLSLIPIIINVTVSFAKGDHYGYGVTTCYISSQEMVIYTFGIPVLIVILSNICMYFIVVYKIRSSPTVQRNVKNERSDLLIFVKLSTVTGATWIFGFIYSWTDIILLSYLFIIFNAGQGIFLMFSLVFNKRVLEMFRSDILGQSVFSTNNANKTSKRSVRSSVKNP